MTRSGPRGYVVAVVGATIGGMALFPLGGLTAIVGLRARVPGCDGIELLTEPACAPVDIFGLIVAFLVSIAAMWIGGIIGCWIGLRLRRHQRGGMTAVLLAILIPSEVALVLLTPAGEVLEQLVGRLPVSLLVSWILAVWVLFLLLPTFLARVLASVWRGSAA